MILFQWLEAGNSIIVLGLEVSMLDIWGMGLSFLVVAIVMNNKWSALACDA